MIQIRFLLYHGPEHSGHKSQKGWPKAETNIFLLGTFDGWNSCSGISNFSVITFNKKEGSLSILGIASVHASKVSRSSKACKIVKNEPN